MRILQLVNGYSKGDGVGNVITSIDDVLKKQGFDADIINRTINYSDIDNPLFQDDTIVLYHLAVSVDPLVSYLKCRKILVFHNITDPELLEMPGMNLMRSKCSAGLYDTARLASFFEGAIVFSDYSKQTLLERGWAENKIFVVPIIVRLDKFASKYDEKIVEQYSDGYTNIIFTGRVFPNKKQEDIIACFAEYRKKYNYKSRLFLVGSIGSNQFYRGLEKRQGN